MTTAAFWTDYDSLGVQLPDTTGFAQGLIRMVTPTPRIHQRWQSAVADFREDLVSDEFDVESYDFSEEGTLVGEPASIEFFEDKRERGECIASLIRMSTDGMSWNFDNGGKITADTAAAAISFLRRMEPQVLIPSVSADGEGGVIMAWKNPDNLVLVTIDNWRIHVATAATTPHAVYLENVPFDGQRIPKAVLDKITR